MFLPGGSGSLKVQAAGPLPPTITSQPAPQNPFAGQTAVFTISADGAPPLFYQWRKGGIALADGGGITGSLASSLVISNVSASEVGNYDVVVSNSVNSVTSSVVALTIQLPVAPAITAQPVPQSAFAGDTVSFSVAATGTAPLACQWRRNGSSLADGGNITGANLTNLSLARVTAADVAGYSVVISNAAGAVTSSVVNLTLLSNNPTAQTTQIQYLSGTDKDHTVPWNFIISSGRNAGIATNIPVPSCWETKGFGTYQYGNLGSVADGETGTYSYTFGVPAGWAGERIFLVFEGSFTDTSVTINGLSVGPTHQGGFYEFKYDVTSFVTPGANTNVLQVVVRRWSNNASVVSAEEKGDFWNFGGLFRPVYLQATPAAYIDRIAVNPKANGQITVNTFLGGITTNYTVRAFVTDSNQVVLGSAFSTVVPAWASSATNSALLPNPLPWSAETPNLYTLTVQLLDANNAVVHTVTNQIGFRTIAFVNGQGFTVNGKRIIMRGVCHHEEWPTSGRTASLQQSDLDLALIRDMNFNTIRMTHYPPSKGFLDECDRLGFYVLDELTGWARAYDNPTAARLVQELVVRDVNHPSIIAWDNGNEGGWNTTVDNNGSGATNLYAVWDPQNRKILRPQSTFDNVVDDHYPSYSGFTGHLGAGKTAYQCTEVLHGLYDGGGGASLQEYWDAMRTAPNGMGMFEWVFADSGQARADQGGIMDVKNQNAPDGVLGPYREKEASYYTYKAVFNPVQVGAPNPANFSGTLAVSNRYDFTDLSQCTFDWQLGMYPDAADPAKACSTNSLTGGFLVSVDSGSFPGPALPAQSTGNLVLPSFPAGWANYDALRLTATDPFGNNLYIWTWPLRTPAQIGDRILGQALASASITAGTSASEIIVTNGTREFHFNKTSGVINSIKVSGQTVSLSNGPRPTDGSTWAVSSFTNYFDGTNYVLLVNDLTNAANGFQWTLRPDGWLKLSYRYTMTGSQNYMGITFDYPTNKVAGMNWVGQGPYRVYKNRLAGQEVFAHSKAFNDTWTGQSTNYSATHGTATKTQWVYPEFAGYHGRLYWASVQTTEQPFLAVTPTTNLFFKMLTPPNSDNSNVNPLYPPGGLAFLHGISPVGDKFHVPTDQGPAAQPYTATGLYSGEVNFFFGALPAVPSSPAKVRADSKSSQVIVSWTGTSDATGYNLKRSTVNGGPYVTVAANLTGLSFTNTGLANGTTYYYVVTADNSNGESKNSQQVSAKPVAAPVIGSIQPAGGGIILSGRNGTAGIGYQVLATTNLLLPLADWSVLATNVFGVGGDFKLTNLSPQPSSYQYYTIQVKVE